MEGDKILSLNVKLFRIGERTIDRDTAVRWMKDGHSFIPNSEGSEGPALQLVEVDGDWFIRGDNIATSADAVSL